MNEYFYYNAGNDISAPAVVTRHNTLLLHIDKKAWGWKEIKQSKTSIRQYIYYSIVSCSTISCSWKSIMADTNSFSWAHLFIFNIVTHQIRLHWCDNANVFANIKWHSGRKNKTEWKKGCSLNGIIKFEIGWCIKNICFPTTLHISFQGLASLSSSHGNTNCLLISFTKEACFLTKVMNNAFMCIVWSHSEGHWSHLSKK